MWLPIAPSHISIFIPCVLATLSATLASILIVGIKQKLKFDGVLLAWLGSLLAIIIGMLVLVQNLPLATKDAVTKHSGSINECLHSSYQSCWVVYGKN